MKKISAKLIRITTTCLAALMVALIFSFVRITPSYADDPPDSTEVKTDDSKEGTTPSKDTPVETSEQVDDKSGSTAHEEAYQKITAKEGSAILLESGSSDEPVPNNENGTEFQTSAVNTADESAETDAAELEKKDTTPKGTAFTNDIPEYVHSVTTQGTPSPSPTEDPSPTPTENPVPTPTEDPSPTPTPSPSAEQYYLTENDELVTLSNADKEREKKLGDDMKSSETVVNTDDQTTTVLTTVKTINAIQKAVDAAIKRAAADNSITELTIHVEDGTYDGDIYIDNTRGGETVKWDTENELPAEDTNGKTPRTDEDWGGFSLVILSKDAYTKNGDSYSINVDSNNNANVTGNIIIKGINTILAGLKYAADTVIQTVDAVLKVYGTSGDDTITVEGKAGASKTQIYVYAGDGDDTINVKGVKPEASSESETEPALRPVASVNDESPCFVYAGKGDDTIKVDSSAACFTNNVHVNEDSAVTDNGSDILVLTGAIKPNGSSGVDTVKRDHAADHR